MLGYAQKSYDPFTNELNMSKSKPNPCKSWINQIPLIHRHLKATAMSTTTTFVYYHPSEAPTIQWLASEVGVLFLPNGQWPSIVLPTKETSDVSEKKLLLNHSS